MVPVAVDQQSGRGGHGCLSDHRSDVVGADLVLSGQLPRRQQVDPGRSVMRDEDLESLGAEPRHIVGVRDLVLSPVDASGAVAPVDGERLAEKAERAATEVEARSSREIGDVLCDSDGDVAVLELGE